MKDNCFHCGLPIQKGASYSVVIDEKQQPMCCIGCEAVAQAIVENNLSDFYKYRTENSSQPQPLIPEELKIYDNDVLQKSFVQSEQGNIREASLILEGIVCAACVWLNERHVSQIAGVISFQVNYTTQRAQLQWDNKRVKLSEILKAISDIGYNAHPFDPSRVQQIHKQEKSAAIRRIALAGLGMMQVMMPAVAIYIGEGSDMNESTQHFLRWVSLLITTPVVLYSSRVFFISAWRDLKRGIFGMDFPVSLAIGSAYLASVWATLSNTGEIYFDSVVMFTFFLLLGRFLEMGARHKAGQVSDELVRLLPQTAIRVDQDEEGQAKQTVIAAHELSLGDHVLVRPGETIPSDGMIIEGSSTVNESLLTGESRPITKKLRDKLVGGSINISSPLTVRIEKLGESTLLSSIIRLLDRAQSEKPPIAKFADKGAGWFVIALLFIAFAVFSVWWFIDPAQAFWVALSVLVITCPCALSLATPTALTATSGHLTQKGVLTTKGHALETLAKITHLIFDKTGTLSHGQYELSETHLLSSMDENECKYIAAGLEAASEHPLAKAIEHSVESAFPIENLSAESGKGVQGVYNHKPYRLGTKAYVQELVGQEIKNEREPKEHSQTTVYLGREGEWLAIFYLRDTLRKEAEETIKQLKSIGIKISLLSGDNEETVNTVAKELKIDDAKSLLLPENKLSELQQLQKHGGIVAMVGDGVNDAPVLAAADVSIAMGKGTQLAQANADMILLNENLSRLPGAIQQSRKMHRIIKQNFSWAIFYNIVAIPIAALGLITPWMAAIGMSMSSLLVVLNSLRLK